MANLELRLINRSHESEVAVVILQQNLATHFDEIAVAWHVIRLHGRDASYTFAFPDAIEVAAHDSFGNKTRPQRCSPGQVWSVISRSSGADLRFEPHSAAKDEIEVRSGLSNGATNINLYRDGRLFAAKVGVVPGQRAFFRFKPILRMGVTTDVEEGEILNSASIANFNSEIVLQTGMTHADLVLTGGSQVPYKFTLVPIK
ncbi:MAG TPA: hypothetical protein VMU84_08535 [Thermoanaerobaculia bacterium]|nr:hypothetical protein [Thermoanaerobaculia bacterium]